MSGWKVGIGYLPPGVSDEAKYLMTEVSDENVQYRVMRLVEQAFAVGYENGFTRCFTEQSWVQFKAKERSRSGQDAANAASSAASPQDSGSTSRRGEDTDG